MSRIDETRGLFSLAVPPNPGYNSIDQVSSNPSTVSLDGAHKTNLLETFLHLLKGYIGCGLLSLPWAVTQIGVVGGVTAIITISIWTSYNCWTVVRLKRYIEKASPSCVAANNDNASDTSSNITYPDVSGWAYGAQFQKYTTACITVQQLAVCTVFVSFIGENLLAVLVKLDLPLGSHTTVITMVLPLILGLAFIPSLKTLAPASVGGLSLLIMSLLALFLVVAREWSDRPSTLPEPSPFQIPLALCAILYSYEGICIILPVESAMEEPKHFGVLFLGTMILVATTLSVVSVLCVTAFGEVNSGSVTAYLLETYDGDNDVAKLIMFSNVAVSFSVLMTYPLQLFPAVELLGPVFQQNRFIGRFYQQNVDEDANEENDLSIFEPLPPIEEHEVVHLDLEEHNYEPADAQSESLKPRSEDVASLSGVSSISSIFPQMIMPGDSPQLRATLVLFTYGIAVVIPNVQALISLAGALAGSSIALLIPPILELAYVDFVERLEDIPDSAVGSSPHVARRLTPKRRHASPKYRLERLKCYVNCGLGFVFMCLGTFFSVVDIVNLYRKPQE